MCVKFVAYYLTNSNAILTDALESIINVVAGTFALFSMYIAIKPSDENHPYGHGKIENLSAGFEGGLIFLAGIWIMVNSIQALFRPPELKALDIGIWLTGIAGLFNYLIGTYLQRQGKKYNSLLMIADGKHLVSDTVSSVGLVLGLLVIQFTGLHWLDSVIAIIFGAVILKTGFHLLRASISGLMDEADVERLTHLIHKINENRRPNWIDIHKLRAVKHGSHLHVDCHLTLPWFISLEEAHNEVRALESLTKEKSDDEMEFFIHSDPCVRESCSICSLSDCKYRQAPLLQKLEWTMANMVPDRKHQATNRE